MKILFITRSYPPIIGGMEEVSYQLANSLSRLAPTHVIANKKGKKFLPLFLPWALVRGLISVKLDGIKIVHLGDGLLTPLGAVIKTICKVPATVTVHGLDVVYPNKIYQYLITRGLKKMDHVIAVSQNTLNECFKRGINPQKCSVIPNGVDPSKFKTSISKNQLRQKLSRDIGIDLKNRKILISVGHLVKRKGFAWFVENVLPKLNKNTLYFIIGGYGHQSQGNEVEKINQLIKRLGLEKRAFLMGLISDEQLRTFYNVADLLIMPNIKTRGDREGFGIVILEAASCGLLTIASDVDGIKETLKDGQNGFLVESKNSNSFIAKINELLSAPQVKSRLEKKAKKYVENYNWEKIAFLYLKTVRNTKFNQ